MLGQEKVAQIINEYSNEIMSMSISLEKIDGPLSDETLRSDRNKARSAINSLTTQQTLNKNAFSLFSAEISDCKNSIDEYCSFIEDVLDGTFGTEGTLEEYSIALEEHHRAIQSSCIALANYSSDVMYGFQ